jgi:hypothetical protein
LALVASQRQASPSAEATASPALSFFLGSDRSPIQPFSASVGGDRAQALLFFSGSLLFFFSWLSLSHVIILILFQC